MARWAVLGAAAARLGLWWLVAMMIVGLPVLPPGANDAPAIPMAMLAVELVGWAALGRPLTHLSVAVIGSSRQLINVLVALHATWVVTVLTLLTLGVSASELWLFRVASVLAVVLLMPALLYWLVLLLLLGIATRMRRHEVDIDDPRPR